MGNPACWTEGYTEHLCCPDGGNEFCWDSHHNFELCCPGYLGTDEADLHNDLNTSGLQTCVLTYWPMLLGIVLFVGRALALKNIKAVLWMPRASKELWSVALLRVLVLCCTVITHFSFQCQQVELSPMRVYKALDKGSIVAWFVLIQQRAVHRAIDTLYFVSAHTLMSRQDLRYGGMSRVWLRKWARSGPFLGYCAWFERRFLTHLPTVSISQERYSFLDIALFLPPVPNGIYLAFHHEMVCWLVASFYSRFARIRSVCVLLMILISAHAVREHREAFLAWTEYPSAFHPHFLGRGFWCELLPLYTLACFLTKALPALRVPHPCSACVCFGIALGLTGYLDALFIRRDGQWPPTPWYMESAVKVPLVLGTIAFLHMCGDMTLAPHEYWLSVVSMVLPAALMCNVNIIEMLVADLGVSPKSLIEFAIMLPGIILCVVFASILITVALGQPIAWISHRLSDVSWFPRIALFFHICGIVVATWREYLFNSRPDLACPVKMLFSLMV